MIIQCEKCKTKFKLDDSRVKDKGVKVRCTKCKHVFRVQKDEQNTELLDQGALLTGYSTPVAQEEEPAATLENQNFTTDEVQDSPFEDNVFEDNSLNSEPAAFSALETTSFDNPAISSASDELHFAGNGYDMDATIEPADKGGEVDFSSFDFGDSESEPDSTPLSIEPVESFTGTTLQTASTVPKKEASQGLDFSDDDIFGAVVPAVAAPEDTTNTITFDFEGDSFAESMYTGGQDSSGKSGTSFSFDTSGDSPFNLGEIDFGDELTSVAVQQVNPEDLQPSQEILFAPLAKAQEKTADEDLKRSFLGDDSHTVQQELPPLSISSRRKRSPLFTAVIAGVSLLVLSVLGYSLLSKSKETVSRDSGKIVVRSVTAAFVENDQAGELLVVSGEALNQFPKSRAALQVKVTIFDAAGGIAATKTAYCGNPLTDEQLVSLPLEKIEAAMANQFGDSLANMEVAPDKSIPFVVVLANLPEGAKDFEVQSAGSTVATGKQQ